MLQQQLQICLHRLPDFILQSCLHFPLQLHQCVEQYNGQSHPFLSQLLTLPDVSRNVQSKTQSSPVLSEPVVHPTSALSPHPKAPFCLKFPGLPLQGLAHLAMHNYASSSKQNPHPVLHPPPADVSSELCFHGQSKSEVHNTACLTERHRANNGKTACISVPDLHQTFAQPHTKLQEDEHKKQEDDRGDQPEEEEEMEEDDSIKGTVLKNCPTDPHYLLHSQNPAECPSVNTLSGFTNGFPQKGTLQSNHKIRVDFKVCCIYILL